MSRDLKVKEVAAILGVTEYTVRTYLKDGVINAYKVNTSWRVSEESLKTYLERLQKGHRK